METRLTLPEIARRTGSLRLADAVGKKKRKRKNKHQASGTKHTLWSKKKKKREIKLEVSITKHTLWRKTKEKRGRIN